MFTPAISPADPNLVLVNCDMSGVYRSTDAGQNGEWRMKVRFHGVSRSG